VNPILGILARQRVTLGFVLGALVLWLAEPTGRSLAAGVPFAMAGEALRVWAAGHLVKAREITTSGPYRWISHPLYLGSAIIGAGVAVATSSLAATVTIAMYLAATITAVVIEERRLLERVAAKGDRHQRFNMARVIANHEERAMLGVLVAVLLLALKATYNDAFWR
jgi:protein-S-isoprenylcysteine O-methyltransferase Ste14